MSFAKTSDEKLVRDLSTNALINTNVSEYDLILQKRKQVKTIQNLQQQIDSLKKDFDDIKKTLLQTINGRA